MCVPYTRINFDKWRVLSVLNKDWEDAELIHTISGEAALLVKNKELYVLGKWMSLPLYTIPMKIKDLDFENICFIASGIAHAVILSNKGFISTFGLYNDCGQLGVEYCPCISRGELVVHHPTIPAIIVDICCGHYFTLALDNDGKVWFWGSVQSGYSCITKATYKKPNCLLITEIVKISASTKRAAALDQSGKVYLWDSFYNHQSKISAPDSLVVQQIACGDENLYILTIEKTLFKYNGKLNPIEPDCQFNYLTTNSNNIFAARSNDGLFYFWEDPYRSGGIYRTRIKNILECFTNSKMPGVCSPSNQKSASVFEEDNTLTENIAQLYNSQKFSDVDITLSDGTIHAHKCILAARSELFSRLLTSIKSNAINFSNANSNVMKSYVTYIYTGSLPEIDHFDHLLELYDLTKDDSNKLSDYCIRQGRSLTNEQNALAYYSASVKFKNTVLMEYCAKLVVKNLKQIATTEQFKTLSPKEFQELMGYGF